MGNTKIKCCPHCGSERGFVVFTDYIGVPYRIDFNGQPLDNSEMYDQVEKFRQHRYAVCDECGKVICTANKIMKQVENQN